ncbi:MAG TPA: hypothetical protein VJ844_03900 [Mucilaginibacter sp.]|nr:hypothetical protein [Mucilaginibacter sp.]
MSSIFAGSQCAKNGQYFDDIKVFHFISYGSARDLQPLVPVPFSTQRHFSPHESGYYFLNFHRSRLFSEI